MSSCRKQRSSAPEMRRTGSNTLGIKSDRSRVETYCLPKSTQSLPLHGTAERILNSTSCWLCEKYHGRFAGNDNRSRTSGSVRAPKSSGQVFTEVLFRYEIQGGSYTQAIRMRPHTFSGFLARRYSGARAPPKECLRMTISRSWKVFWIVSISSRSPSRVRTPAHPCG